MFQTPIVYIIFNRPNHTKKTFEVIRKLKPTKLFIIADGPRSDFTDDKKNCLETRRIVDNIDWECEIFKNYEISNIGPKKKITTGLNWVFEHVDRAIILEDDCLADSGFFDYCEELLNYYEKNNKIWIISGNNFQNGNWRGKDSYFFSKYPHTWGWATWKRAWTHYTDNIPFWDTWKHSQSWKNLMQDKVERKYWEKIFNRVYSGSDTYAFDYAWVANIWYNEGITVAPNVNLVSNIGHDIYASSTKSPSNISNLKIEKLRNPLTHPETIKLDQEADIYDFNYTFGGKKMRFPNNLIEFPRRVIVFFIRLLKKFIQKLKVEKNN